MYSSDSTTQPFVWQSKSRVKLVVWSVLGLLSGAAMTSFAVPMLSDSRWREGGLALSIALFAVTVTTNPWFNQNSSKYGSAVLDRVRGSTVRYERWGLLWLSVVTASAAAMFAFVLLFTTPLLLTFFVSLALRSVRNGWVELDADGVRHRGWSFDMQASWDSIRTVQIEDRKVANRFKWRRPVIYQCVSLKPDIVLLGYRRHTARVWRIEKMSTRTIDLDCRRFDIHPVVLQQWIAYYLHNPKMRHELGTDAAAQRLAAITV